MNFGEMLSYLQNLKSNPMAFLMQRKYNVPQDISNDPNKILQYLLSTGQVSQEQYNSAYQQAMMFRNNK